MSSASSAAAAAPSLRAKEDEVRALVHRHAGQRLPGERELAARLQITRPQLRVILGALRREGLVEQRQGSGTYSVGTGGAATAASARPRGVALLVDENLKLGDDPFFSLLLERLQASLQGEGVRCVIERVRAGEGAAQARTPRPEDGAVTLGLAGAELLAHHGGGPGAPPLVALLPGPEARPRRRASLLEVEDREAGREAARYLIGAGCRRLVFVGRESIPASRERGEGAREVAEAAGIAFALYPSGLSHAAGLRAGRAMPVEDPAATGVIATNDWLAVGLRAGLTERGLRALPLVSFDGLPLAADPGLNIASLAMPVGDIVADAVAELFRLHRSPAAAGRTVRYPFAWRDDATEESSAPAG